MLFFYKLLRDKRLAHEALLEKNEEINQQKEEILAQRDELEEHRDKLIKHREEIDSSIRYAKQIQNARITSYNVCYTKLLRSDWHMRLFLKRTKK